VFVLKGEQVQARTVTTGIRNTDKVEILSGLRPGEQVVVAGAGYLKDGDYVRLPKNN
jgi:HlyD family secretion protein